MSAIDIAMTLSIQIWRAFGYKVGARWKTSEVSKSSSHDSLPGAQALAEARNLKRLSKDSDPYGAF
jgi:hypothetical protein